MRVCWKKESYSAWLDCGTAEAADRYQQAEHAVARAAVEVKALVWEKFREAIIKGLKGSLANH